MARVNLDTLLGDAGEVTLDGEAVTVRPLDGAAYETLKGFDDEAKPDVSALYAIAERCLPSLSHERVLQLTPKQVGAVLAVAGQHVEEVSASLPKSKRSRGTRRSRPG